jgi:YD repeat-containing protein
VYIPGEEEYFRSNELGMTLEKIVPFMINDYPYVLVVKKEGESVQKILYLDSVEDKKWQIEYMPEGKRELYFERGDLMTSTLFTDEGLIRSVDFYSGEEVTERYIYQYSGNSLQAIVVTDSEGSEISKHEYVQDRKGRLRRFVKIYPDKEAYISAYTFGEDYISQEWHGTLDEGDMFRFNTRQKTVAIESWQGSTIIDSEEYFYSDGNLALTVQIDMLTGILTRTWFDEQGEKNRLLREINKSLIEEIQYEYDEAGNLVLQHRRTPGLKEKWEYLYDPEGERSVEYYYKKDQLISKIEYVHENEYIEFLYRGGTPFVKNLYRDDQKVEETLLIDLSPNSF